MKTRESGMPGQEIWEAFFDPAAILDQLQIIDTLDDAVDFGCGYGTFALPAAKRIRGTLYGLDIDPAAIEVSRRRAEAEDINNIDLQVRDFVRHGAGLPAESVSYVMLFNILHAEDPLNLLGEAWRILVPEGQAGIIHWNYDATTPRGPSLDIRPRPKDCCDWLREAGFRLETAVIDLPPHHYGLVGRKTPTPSRV